MRKKENILDDIFLQPWFLSVQTANAVRNLIPAAHHHKMRAYFDDYGCLRCGKSDVRYGSNGMCKPCVQSVKLKMLFAVRRRWKQIEHETKPRSFNRVIQARQLLADLRSRVPIS